MSTDRFPRGQTAIVGHATFGEGLSPGFSSIDLAAAASTRAAAGIGMSEKAVERASAVVARAVLTDTLKYLDAQVPFDGSKI